MAASLSEDLVDSVYRVVLEPAAWGDVMDLMAQTFPSAAQTFYYLHRNPRRLEPVCLAGIEPARLRNFNELYFASDNPWMRLTERLHRPGVVRTNERLDHVLQERGALYRSAYYHEWMRPQGLRYSLGNTLVAEGDLVANVTLFRPPGMKTFSTGEVRTFEAVSRHMARALQMAIRLDHPENVPAAAAALEALAQPVALVDGRRRLRYANASMESLLRRRGGLAVRAGELVASATDTQQALAAYLDRRAVGGAAGGEDRASLALRDGAGHRLTLNAVPVRNATTATSTATSCCLITVTPERADRSPSNDELRASFGCTPAEARLALSLGRGCDLRTAAREGGITYETARAYLKRIFAKTGVHTQSQLVALMLRGTQAPTPPR